MNWNPKAMVAPIATVSNLGQGMFSDLSEDSVAVDMEGYGLWKAVSTLPDVDVAVVRGISHLLDEHAREGDDDLSELAAESAAAFAFEMLANWPTKTLKFSQEPPRRELVLKHLRVHDARCFGELDVAFSDGDQPRMFSMLVGRNGAGKTSFLRALALGLCQQKETSGLIGKLAGEFIRQDKAGEKGLEASIELDLMDPADPDAVYRTKTKVTRDKSGQEIVTSETEPADFPWSDLFVCGYGVNRGAGSGSPPPAEYRRLDAVASLFDDDVGLVDPESVLRSLKMGDYEAKAEPGEERFSHVERHLLAVLGLEPADRIEVTSKQVMLSGPWGTMPFHALGDGYRGTLGWLLDLIGRAYLAGRLANDGAPAGIVLIDEIDEHLHPSWQRKLITTLKKSFPKVQFVGTTHSPMAIVNCTHSELLASELQDGVAGVHPLAGPHGRTADRILRGEWFGLTSTMDDESEALLVRYEDAVRRGAGEDEVAPLRNLVQNRLGVLFDSPIDELALEIAAEVRRQHRGEVSTPERAQLISAAAQRLRQRIKNEGFTRRTPGSTGDGE